MIAALLVSGEAQAQSLRRRAAGLSRQHLHRLALQGGQTAPPHRHPARGRPPARQQRAAALERRGRRLRPSPDDGSRDPRGGGEFRQLRRLDVARRRPAQHLAGKLPALYRRAHARSAHHGPDGFAAGIHQVDLGLSRHPGQRRQARQGPRDPRQIQAAVRRGGKGLRRRSLCRSRRSGASNRTIPPRWAIAACCNPPRRWPASAAARNISGTSSSRRWKSCTTAICVPNRCAAPGPARSARRNSCRPRSSATRSMPMATAAATWSTIPPT